ncbi:NPC intracellular cholesterol transporter 2-like [Culicoides brevitarsis]|uniref:NPC intracellular cholesterol transporter 2-like n=1 Tax=Culicoides brevitarsis TaxID=469753 RepID=UPI00307B7A00
MKLFAIFVVICIASASATDFLGCKKGKSPVAVDVEGCTKTPCKLKRGTDVDFLVTFNSEVVSQSLKPKVLAHVQGLDVPYPLPPEFADACKHLTEGECPLLSNTNAKYQISFPVKKEFPAVRVTVEYSLLNEKDEVVTCFQVPIQTV